MYVYMCIFDMCVHIYVCLYIGMCICLFIHMPFSWFLALVCLVLITRHCPSSCGVATLIRVALHFILALFIFALNVICCLYNHIYVLLYYDNIILFCVS